MDRSRLRAQRGATVPAACHRCRQLHAKCDGQRPTCLTCQIRGADCRYATATSSETHSQAMKRKIDELQSRHDALADFIQLLQNGRPDDAFRALAALRSGADPASVTRLVHCGDVRFQQILQADSRMRFAFPYVDAMPPEILTQTYNPYCESRLFQATLGALPSSASVDVGHRDRVGTPSAAPYCIPFQHARLVDPLLALVTPETWTEVPVSNAKARHLLETYFLRDYPFFTFLHKDHFLQDMQDGKERFCSSLLVNALLAYACHGDTELKGRADFWRPQSLCYQFTAEARRLWDMECMSPSITVVQAGMLLSASCNIDGLDRLGWKYLCTSFDVASSLSLFDDLVESASNPTGANRLVTAWSLYGWQGLCAFILHKKPLRNDFGLALQPVGAESSKSFGEIWVLYPGDLHPVALWHETTFRALATFRSILCDLACLNAPAAGKAQLQSLLAIRSRLQDWIMRLPLSLRSENIVYPSHLKMHAHFHEVEAAVLEACRGLLTVNPTHGFSHGDMDAAITKSHIFVESLLRLYYVRHGYEAWDNMLIQTLNSVASRSLLRVHGREVHSVEYRTAMSTLLLCMKGLLEQSKNFYLGEVLYLLHRFAMGKEHGYLLQHLGDNAHRVDPDDERLRLMSRYVRSAWPLDALGTAMKAEDKMHIDDLVAIATSSDPAMAS